MALLEESKSYKPFSYPWAVEYAIKSEKAHWGEWEAKLQDDVAQWNNGKLTDAERNHITQILRLFTQSDVQVGTNYLESYIPKFKNNEIRAMLTSFANREFVHQRSYAILNDTLGLPESEFSAFAAVQEMSYKLEFMSDIDVGTQSGLCKAVARSVINEGMSLFSAFVMLLNYQRFGKMRGMCEIVEWSIRDESMHSEAGCWLFRTLIKENPKLKTQELEAAINEAALLSLKLELDFINKVYELGDLEGCSKYDLEHFIKNRVNTKLGDLGYKPIVSNIDTTAVERMKWFDHLSAGKQHSDFFSTRVTNYSKGHIMFDESIFD